MAYPEAGPSRPPPPFRRDDVGRSPWSRREDDRDRDDGRSRLSEPSGSRPSPGNWSRPPSRSYRPGSGARSNTPSPTRRYDRDRDRDRFQSDSRRGFGPPPGPGPIVGGPSSGGRDRDWSDRRWPDQRERWARDYSPPRGNGPPGRRNTPQPPSYGSGRPHSPPRGPRALNGSGNRVTSNPSLNGGSRPSTSTNGVNPVPLPRAPRSMRGSSSPVELRHTITDPAGPSSVPSKTVDLPEVKAETIDEADLEEGEVISPVRRPIEPSGLSSTSRPGDRWAPPRRRGSLSPRKQSFRSRPPSPDRRDWERDRQRDWRDYRRSLSPVIARPKLERQDSGRNSDTRPLVKQQADGESPRPRSPPRPSTPPIPSPVLKAPQPARDSLKVAAPPRPDTPLLPDSQSSEPFPNQAKEEETVVPEQGRPHTPELPIPAHTSAAAAEESADVGQGSVIEETTMTVAPSVQASTPSELKAQDEPRDPDAALSQPLGAGARLPQSPVQASPPRQEVAPSHEVDPTSPSDTAVTPALDDTAGSPRVEVVQPSSSGTKIDVDEPVEELMVKLLDNETVDRQDSAIQQMVSPPLPRVTIAERRSVKLPDTAAPLSSPFNARIRKDSMPTAGSGHSSTDAETEDGGPRTAELRDDPPSAELSDGAVEELKRVNFALAVKRISKNETSADFEAVYAWNTKVAPHPSSRVPRAPSSFDPDHRLRQITWPLNRTQQSVAKLVSVKIQKERRSIDIKLKDLRSQYKSLHDEWEEHCKGLDAQMEKRGPPPADLYDIPNAFRPPPVAGTGSVLPSPSVEEPSAIGRANRRRGGGDFVATDADLEEIMANLKQIDDQDPTFRARKTTATVPDMLLGADRLARYNDDNDVVDDPMTFYDFAGKLEPIWTPEEKEVFRRIYPNCSKQFGKVADKLPNKSVGDCVQYYYRTKKDIDWKGLVAAKRGGERKRSRAAGKKPGKSSALLADLERQKPTVNPNTAGGGPGGKSTITPGRPGKGSRQGAATPSEAGGGKRRKTAAVMDTATVDGVSSEATSRAGSEAPGAKAKMRMSIKGKRPRVSSATGLTAMADPSIPGAPTDSNGPTTPAPLTATPLDPQAELLPPPKRPGKRRKMAGTDPDAPSTPLTSTVIPGTAPSTTTPAEKSDKPRRSNTNSYWSVDEKKLVRSLHVTFGDDMEQIASRIPGKSVRQVTNWLASRAGAGAGSAGDTSIDTEDKGIFTARSATYNNYGSDQSFQQQPRLGTFPTARSTSPVKPFSRPGGMQISALLNNDDSASVSVIGHGIGTAKPNLDALEAASDGTVEDEGIARPPSRSVGMPSRQPPPDLDRYKTKPYESAFHPNTHTQSYYPSTHWDHPHQQQQHHYPHPPTSSSQPQMGVFGPPPQQQQYQGRTVYSAKLEQEMGLPPPRNRGRSDGPAFSGFPPAPGAQMSTERRVVDPPPPSAR